MSLDLIRNKVDELESTYRIQLRHLREENKELQALVDKWVPNYALTQAKEGTLP